MSCRGSETEGSESVETEASSCGCSEAGVGRECIAVKSFDRTVSGAGGRQPRFALNEGGFNR